MRNQCFSQLDWWNSTNSSLPLISWIMVPGWIGSWFLLCSFYLFQLFEVFVDMMTLRNRLKRFQTRGHEACPMNGSNRPNSCTCTYVPYKPGNWEWSLLLFTVQWVVICCEWKSCSAMIFRVWEWLRDCPPNISPSRNMCDILGITCLSLSVAGSVQLQLSLRDADGLLNATDPRLSPLQWLVINRAEWQLYKLGSSACSHQQGMGCHTGQVIGQACITCLRTADSRDISFLC